ncbi:unnamed protein product (macronuclear) [Paramecium tetraurelia]|uniref:Uncharacterized protein n=1 Tax=Paramecium tetraurelia TaxID=5888 RepID=A0E4C1_PARTE|nr:uncharacterized protein GSPATT00023312001 [Paramecium tetraurelia]CAK90138.1 unnamed protein product [Paramecium tetraurelia]|eukprot:XP_001457535.1 hypothetical protein (macronuclear) [Paramecium tetraurelia strain d4-2]
MEQIEQFLASQKCQRHQKQLSKIFCENSEEIKLQQCILCVDCEKEVPNSLTIGLPEFIRVCNKNNQNFVPIEVCFRRFENIFKLLRDIQQKVRSQIDDVEKCIEQEKNALSQKTIENQIKQIVRDENPQSQIIRNEINKININFTTKIIQKLDSLKNFEEQKKCREEIEELKREFNLQQQIPQQQQQQQSKLQQQLQQQQQQQQQQQLQQQQIPQQRQGFIHLDNSNQQSETCYSISFNHSNSLMISGCNNFIKLWEFKAGQLNLIKHLEGHQEIVTNLLFSSISNNFVSGSIDGHLICWSYLQQSQIKKSQTYEFHEKGISCMILNKKENLLFTSDMDKQIIIWDADLSSNLLSIHQVLDNHTKQVNGLSLNETENILVSCGLDKQIIVWQKVSDQWIFKKNVNQQSYDFGTRIKFINNDRFLWVSGSMNGQDYLFDYQFNIQNDYIQKRNKSFLSEKDSKDSLFFPIFFNKEKNIVIVKHKLYIYLYKKDDQGLLNSLHLKKLITNDTYGAITSDGQFLVSWDQSNQRYEVCKIII